MTDEEEKSEVENDEPEEEESKVSHQQKDYDENYDVAADRDHNPVWDPDRQVVDTPEGNEKISWLTPKPKMTSLILTADGNVDPKPIKGQVRQHYSGAYPIYKKGMYWNESPIPRGWISVHVQGRPRPVQDGEYKGWGAKHAEAIIGPLGPHLMNGGLKAPGFQMTSKMWLIVLGLAALVLFGILEIFG